MYWKVLEDFRGNASEGQEKYLRELSITPVGYFTGATKNHSRAVSHRNYFAWQKAKMRYFRGTGVMDKTSLFWQHP
jgi:hypothetical protein